MKAPVLLGVPGLLALQPLISRRLCGGGSNIGLKRVTSFMDGRKQRVVDVAAYRRTGESRASKCSACRNATVPRSSTLVFPFVALLKTIFEVFIYGLF